MRSSDAYKSHISVIKGVVQAHSGYKESIYDLSFSHRHISDNLCEVSMSGTSVGYFMTSSVADEIDARIASVSIGGCLINVTVMRKLETSGYHMLPVRTTSTILHSLTSITSQTVGGITFTPELKRVVMKFRRIVDGNVVGPALTLGNNGGIQWIGSPSLISSTLKQFFNHAASKIATEEFSQSVSRSVIGTINVYPAGVKRQIRD